MESWICSDNAQFSEGILIHESGAVFMTLDEISKYTTDGNIMFMPDFKHLADSCETLDEFREKHGEDYDDAASAVYDCLFSALRVAQWAQMYKGVHIDTEDLKHLKKMMDDLKADERLEKHD